METMEKTKTLEPETLAPDPETGAETLALEMPANSEEPGFGTPSGGDRTPIAAGDLVWGRIKGCNWWPGRVCDRSQPSDRGKKPYRSVPVSYFGDGTVSWCNLSQLKPFVENFHQMAGSSQSESFAAALESALGEIGRCLEVQMVCYCVPEEERNGLEKYFSMNPGVGNYSEREFLDLVKNVAVDLSVVDSLGIARLRSRVVAYERGCSYADPTACHRRKGIKELVDKIDLDVQPSDLLEEREEDEERVGVSLSPNERSRRSKRRSIAVLIAEMDSDSVDVSVGKKDKYGSRMAENGSSKEEDTGPGRRERKKSKYLSPPYTYLSGGIGKLLASDDSLERKIPRSSRASVTRSLSAIKKSDAEEIWREEDEESSPVLKFDSVSVDEVLSEFLATAINPLHLKYNRAAKTVTGFFAKYRSSVYSSGAEFVAYQKRAAESDSVDMEIVNREVSDKIDKGEKSEEKRERRRRRRKDKANGDIKTPLESDSRSTDQSVKKDRAAGKRKMTKEGTDGETPASSMVKLVAFSGEGNLENKKENRPAEGNYEDEAHSGGKTLNIVESGTKGKKSNNGKRTVGKRKITKEGADGETPASSTVKLVAVSGEGNLENKKEKRPAKDKANGDSKTPLEPYSQSTDQSVKKDTAVGKRKMTKEGGDGETPAISMVKLVAVSGEGNLENKKEKRPADGETPAISMVKLVAVSGEGNLENKKEKRPAEGNYEAEAHSGGKTLNIVESGTKGKKSNNGKKVVNKKNLGVNDGDKNDSKEANSSQEKKRRSKIPVSVMNKIKKALNGPRPGGGFKSPKDSTLKVYPAALLLNFSQGINLPAREDLISAYTKYGNLIESEVEILKESNSARVVFMRCTDAEKAFNDKAGPFGPPVASYRLHYLAGNPNYPPVVEPSPPAPKPPLPYIRKSLERMISSLNETSTTSEDNLLGEMQGLLTKVDRLLSRPADGISN